MYDTFYHAMMPPSFCHLIHSQQMGLLFPPIVAYNGKHRDPIPRYLGGNPDVMGYNLWTAQTGRDATVNRCLNQRIIPQEKKSGARNCQFGVIEKTVAEDIEVETNVSGFHRARDESEKLLKPRSLKEFSLVLNAKNINKKVDFSIDRLLAPEINDKKSLPASDEGEDIIYYIPL